jgi:protein serine kinase H
MGCLNSRDNGGKAQPGAKEKSQGAVHLSSSIPTSDNPEAKSSQQSGNRQKSSTNQARPHKKPPFLRDKFDPRVLQKYEIKALIGRGSFSKVVRVENKKTKQPYAIKMVEQNGGRELFHAEVAVLQRVVHENVVKLYEVLETRERAYLVMELATGGELFDRIVARGVELRSLHGS